MGCIVQSFQCESIGNLYSQNGEQHSRCPNPRNQCEMRINDSSSCESYNEKNTWSQWDGINVLPAIICNNASNEIAAIS